MGGNYEKGLYNQLMEVMGKLDAMESEHRQDRMEIRALTEEVTSLRKENTSLRDKLGQMQADASALREKAEKLEQENSLLRDDNERMKRILGNDSSNSSIPPSAAPPWKAPNSYNARKASKKKPGAQPGHKGSGLSKSGVERKIKDGVFRYEICDIGDPSRDYVTRYVLDLKTEVTATEIRIHADESGKYQIPDGLRGDVSYGDQIKAVCAYLYGEGIVSIDRISDFINALSGNVLSLSAGTVYNLCSRFAGKCGGLRESLEDRLLNSHEICTDATPVTNNGKMNYIRNFSTEDTVLYCSCEKKDLDTLGGLPVLKKFSGILCHDHETSLYHFGTGHAECNVHLCRYLRKNTEETGNLWSRHMESFLNGMNCVRRELKEAGQEELAPKKLERYLRRYDEIVAEGRIQNRMTRGRIAKKEEAALLKRLEKHKENHLLFLQDFQVHYSNNMSEKDLRVCKGREKMAGGFRTEGGLRIYCNIMSFIETIKRRKENIFSSIAALMNGKPVKI